MRGADIFGFLFQSLHLVPRFRKKERGGVHRTRERSEFRFVSRPTAERRLPGWRRCYMSIGTIILIILIIALLGGFSGIGGGPFYRSSDFGGRRRRPHGCVAA